MSSRRLAMIVAVVAALSNSSMARAEMSHTFNLQIFNNATYAGLPGLSYTVQVSGDVKTNRVTFRITNTSTVMDSVVTGVYFDDGTLLGIAKVINGPGVEFLDASMTNVSPPDLPGGNKIGFETHAGFALDANNPSPKFGLGNGEYVDIIFELIDGQTINDTLAAMGDISHLRVGIHIQQLGLDGEYSASAVTTVVPVPPALALGALGLGMVGFLRRRLES